MKRVHDETPFPKYHLSLCPQRFGTTSTEEGVLHDFFLSVTENAVTQFLVRECYVFNHMGPYACDLGLRVDSRSGYPGVIDASDALLRPVQHQEGCQIGSIGSHDYHGEACPHHTQNPR